MVNIPACVNPFRTANEEISRLIPSRSLNVISICIRPSFWNPKFLCFMNLPEHDKCAHQEEYANT